MSQYLGDISAYALAVSQGYTGTEEEYAELMASYADVGQTAVDAKDAALAAKTAAQTAATTATNKATEATTAATTATTKAGEASTSASTATSAKDTAVSASQTATTKATEATTAAATAVSAKDNAVSANTAAQSAKTAAQTAQTSAETAAASVSASAAQIATNAADKGVTDSVPYHYRKTVGDGADRLYDQIVGGTVCWNQLLNNMRSSSTTNGLTFVNNNGALTISGTVTEAFDYNTIMLTNNTVKFKRDGSKYFVMLNKGIPFAWGVGGYGNVIPVGNRAGIWTNNSGGVWTNGLTFKAEVGQTVDIQELRASIFNLTAMFGSTIADYIYSLEQSTAGAGVAFFRKLFPRDYYPYNSGELKSVEGVSAHETVGFNQFDKNTVLNGYIIDDSTGDIKAVSVTGKATDYIPVIPKQTYYIKSDQVSGAWGAWYDADKNYISSITGYIKDGGNVNKLHTAPADARYMRLTCFYNNSGDLNTLCVNISDPARNGEYEPYKAHRYSLDSTLILRGTPQLVDGKIKWDGDTYDADGTVTRRYGVVDLGTLIWTKSTDYANPIFYARISDLISGVQDKKLVCTRYDYAVGLGAITVADYTTPIIGTPDANTQVIVRDPNYDSSDAATFKAAMSGVMLVYRLATPTTEQADPYQHLQQCDPNGTEEYVSTGIVPVGHNSFYPENLRAKVEQLPWNFASLIAPTEATFTATRNYTTGALFIVDNVLYKATSNIANGGTITPNTNCTATTLAEIISALA